MAIRFAICNELFEGWPLEHVFSYARDVGYDGVELAPFTLAQDIRLCRDLGGRIMVFGSPKQRNVQEADTYQAAWDRAVESFRICGDEAARHGVTIALEPLTEKEANFLTTRDEAVRLIEAIGSPGIGLHLDVKAMVGQEEKPPEQIIHESADQLVHFHANDINLRGPGMGETDHRPIAAALRDIGYNGCVSVEVFDYSPGPEETATRSIEYLQEVFSA